LKFVDFSSFINSLKQQFELELPGELAQFKMAPLGRPPKELAVHFAKKVKQSAVLILLYPDNGEIKTVLMERNSYNGVHSKQISFPGGKTEPEDTSAAAAALREFEEEVGVERSQITIVGELTELFIPPSGFLVNPFVGYTDKKPKFTPDNQEVKSLLFTSLDSLLDDKNKMESKVVASGKLNITTPSIICEGHVIWGATAMMISEFEEIITATKKHLSHA
jgi:8-oxo-dGTP pyrophosphatase MutT (NUDIX family)|tara:strand:+ start:144 stop:806 length:663 start_codon:yes stop_codon:yes gene_type:complete